MSDKNNTLVRFGKFRLDAEKKILWHDGEVINLPLKEIELLCVLTESDELVTKDEILTRVWQDSFVEESNLSSHVYRLRKMFAKFGESEDIIQTVPKRGYRFKGEVVHTSNFPDLIIERHSISQTLIEEIETSIEPELKRLPPPSKINYWWMAVLVGLILVAGVFGYYFYNRTQPEEIKSIAVLPLKSFDNKMIDENLGLRMADSIITKLGKIESVSVRPTSSIAKFLQSSETTVEIGKELIVDAILEGLIQRENNQLRVTVQLVSVKNGKQIWSEQFDGEADKLLDLQSKISGKLLTELNLRLTKEQETKFAQRPTNNSDAYEQYLKGRYFWQKRKLESLKSAVSAFEKAISLDPDFADAYVGLADSYYLLFDYSYDTSPKNVELAKKYLAKALEINPNLAEAHATQGYIQTTYEWNWKKAEESFLKAIELSPNLTNAHHRYGMLLIKFRRFAEAEKQLQIAKSLDPTSPSINTNLGVAIFFAKRFDEAENQFNQALQLDSNFNAPIWYFARLRWAKGEKKDFLLNYAKAIRQEGDDATAKILERDLNSLGEKESLQNLSREWQKQIGPTGINDHDIAILEALQGNKDSTLDWLEKSVAARHPWATWINAEPEFDFVRDEPKFKALLNKMNLQ